MKPTTSYRSVETEQLNHGSRLKCSNYLIHQPIYPGQFIDIDRKANQGEMLVDSIRKNVVNVMVSSHM
jgi:hypothetical protein